MQPKTAKRRSAFRRANRAMPRRRIDIAIEAIDYKNPDLLKKFVTESGKILPRRITGMPAHLHRKITREINDVATGCDRLSDNTPAFSLLQRAKQRRRGYSAYTFRVRSPCSINFQNSRLLPSC